MRPYINQGPDAPVPMNRKEFYECGCCSAWHSDEWWGDCRQDNARFDFDDLDRMFGHGGWIEVPMCEDTP